MTNSWSQESNANTNANKSNLTNPRPLSRADSFFGIHFDFHALATDRNIGANTNPELVNAIIDLIHPDYIEVDTKGHPGYSSYPTKVGNHNGSFVGDPLRVWRETTAKRGVALYGHYSGLWDDRAIQLHPEWGVLLNMNGTRSTRNASISGPYVDQLLIPQLKELALDYQLDGAWIDGNTWSFCYDYSEGAQREFNALTGQNALNPGVDQAKWPAWGQFQREKYRNYDRYVISKVKSAAPKFQIGDNWAFTDMMPEPVSIDVDFISGDICGFNCVNVCRHVSRLMMTQEIPWDLMAWSFHTWSLGKLDPPESRKPAIQLEREAACVIAQGGGFQAVFSQAGPGQPPRRDGSVDLEKLKPMAEVAKFCRARQEICFKAKAVPQIALLLSTENAYFHRDQNCAGFSRDKFSLNGITNAIIENQYALEIYVTQNLIKNIYRYPLVVVCENDRIESTAMTALSSYVKRGGHLLVLGENAIQLFQPILKSASKQRSLELSTLGPMNLYAVEKGRIGTISKPMNTEYKTKPTVAIRDDIGRALAEIFPDPLVKVTGSHEVDLSIMKTPKGELAIHLVNTSGPHRTAGIIPKIDPIKSLALDIRFPGKPKSVRIEPGNKPVKYTCKNGHILLTIDELPIHEIVVIE